MSERSRRKRTLEVLKSVFNLAVLPGVAWLLATRFLPSPPLVAPYVLMSPFIAITLGALLMARRMSQQVDKFRPRDTKELEHDPAVEELAAVYAVKAGLDRVDVFRDPGQKFGGAARRGDGVIRIHPGRWAELDDGQQRFVLAHEVADMLLRKRMGTWLSDPVISGAIVFGGIVACYNMWLIIPMHLLVAGVYVYSMHRMMRSAVVEADIQALKWTSDLDSAIRYVNKQEDFTFFLSTEQRIRALRRCAEEMAAGR